MKTIEWDDLLESLPEEFRDEETMKEFSGNAKFIVMEDKPENTEICLDRHCYVDSENLHGIFVPGDLDIKLIYNSGADFDPLALVVLGKVSTDAIVVTGSKLTLLGEATCNDLFWGNGHGQLKATDRVEAAIFVATNDYDVERYWENFYFDYPLVDGSDQFGTPHLELVEKLFKDDVAIKAKGSSTSWADFLNRDMITALYLKGQTALKPVS